MVLLASLLELVSSPSEVSPRPVASSSRSFAIRSTHMVDTVTQMVLRDGIWMMAESELPSGLLPSGLM